MTKNFNFINDVYETDFWFIDYDEYKNNINELEEYIKSRKFNLIPNFIRIFSEKILCNVLIKKNVDLPDLKSIKSLIRILNDTIGIDREFSSAFHRVADYSNSGSHYSENELDNFEIFSLIKSFHLFLVYLLRLNPKNAWLKPEFNIKLYNIDYDNEISKEIISIEKYNEFEKQNDSITKNISIKDVNIYNLLFDKKIFNIPIYQRGYNWNEKNINDLLNDIYLRMNDKTCHYFGVVAGKIIDTKDDITYIKIIDGQQRLTTSILIVMGCYYLLKENDYKDLDKEFSAYFNCLVDINFNKLFQNPGAKEVENNEFEEILSKNYNINNLKRKSNFSTNLNLIINFLRNKFNNDNDKIIKFLNVFTNKFILGLVDFNKYNNSNKKELEIFENLNSKGKSLELNELIKNQLFNLCSNDVLKEKETNLVIEYNRLFGNLKNEQISNFFKNLNYFFKGEETNSDGMSQEHARFKDFKEITLKEILKISNINKDDNLTFNEFKKVLATISTFLENAFKVTYNINHHYARTHNISEILSLTDNPKKTMLCGIFCWFNTIDSNFINDSKNSKIIFESVLHIFKVTTTLKIFKNSSDSNPTKRFFEKINNEYKTRNINDLKSCKDFIINKIKISLLTKDNNLLERKDFSERLNTTIKNSKAVDFQKILLLLISYKLTNNNPSETSNSKITLEHILPRKPENWIHDLREWDENLKTKTNDEIINLSENYIDSLGNLILISDNDNKKIGNKTFAEKQKKLNSFQYKNILFCSNDYNIDISKKDKWTFESITCREKYLYTLIFEIYNSIF